VRVRFVCAHIHERGYAAAGIGRGQIHEATMPVPVGNDAAGDGSIVAGVNHRGNRAQAIVAHGGGRATGRDRRGELRVGVEVAHSAAAPALDVAEGNGGSAVVVVDFRLTIAPQNAVDQRGVTVVVGHPAAVVGPVAAEADVRQRGAAAVVVAHPAADVGGPIAAEDAVRQRGAAGVVVHPAAAPGLVAAEGDVRQCGVAVPVVVHSAAIDVGLIAAEDDVRQRGVAAAVVEHPAAA